MSDLHPLVKRAIEIRYEAPAMRGSRWRMHADTLVALAKVSAYDPEDVDEDLVRTAPAFMLEFPVDVDPSLEPGELILQRVAP